MAAEIKERVINLEETLNRFIINVDKTLYEVGKEIRSLSKEMKEFREESQQNRERSVQEMKAFKEEMRVYRENSKQETKAFKEEMRVYREKSDQNMTDFKEEMRVYRENSKQETKAFKEEMRASRKALDKKWGDLVNKLGTFAEDIAAPNIPRIAREQFGEPNRIFFATGLEKKHPEKKGTIYEFDAVLETDNCLFLLESKYTVRGKYIEGLPKIIDNFKMCFPQYADKTLVPIFASMKIHESSVKRLTRMGIYAMAMGDSTMELLNFEELQGTKK